MQVNKVFKFTKVLRKRSNFERLLSHLSPHMIIQAGDLSKKQCCFCSEHAKVLGITEFKDKITCTGELLDLAEIAIREYNSFHSINEKVQYADFQVRLDYKT